MAEFGTIDVYTELARALDESADWHERGKGLSYRIAFRYDEPIDNTFVLGFDDGRITEVVELAAAVSKAVDYTLSASPNTWRSILDGRRSPMVAITTGKLKVDGDLPRLLKHMSAFGAVLAAMSAVELT